MSRTPRSEDWSTVIKLLGSLTAITVILTATVAGSYRLALRLGMSEDNFMHDMIIANAAIVIHLTLEWFLHQGARALRRLITSLLRWFFWKQ